MKSLVFDAGPVISLTTNNLLWLLGQLKPLFHGEFYIPKGVKSELVDKPLSSVKFKFEALQVKNEIKKSNLVVIDNTKITMLAEELLVLANNLFKIRGNWLTIVHFAEMEVLSTAIVLNSLAVVIDERTTKMLVENPLELAKMFEERMGSKISINQKNLDKIREWTKGIKVLRSVELVMIAYEKGLMKEYLPDGNHAARTLVESLLWGVKIHGCAISKKEIDLITIIETSDPKPE